MDKPLRKALTLLAVIIIVEAFGVSLYLRGYQWGIIVTVGFAALIQGVMLVLIWYTFKVVFHMGNDMVRLGKNVTKQSETETPEKTGDNGQ
jgi:mannose/fructose/N-acetylgalactosamine-specific phosphotransferase system component IID